MRKLLRQGTSDLLHNEVFKRCSGIRRDNPAKQNGRGYPLIFNNANRDIRLIGIFPPLQGGLNNLPAIRAKSMAPRFRARTIQIRQTAWVIVLLPALGRSEQHNGPSCVMCHANRSLKTVGRTRDARPHD